MKTRGKFSEPARRCGVQPCKHLVEDYRIVKTKIALAAFLLLGSSGTVSRAQQPPAAPPLPPQPGIAPSVFSIQLDGGNFLGVQTEDLTRENATRYQTSEPRGVGVSEIVSDSPAARAGVRVGDVILRFDGEDVTSVRKLVRLINEAAPGQSARLTISRAGAQQEITVTLGARRDFGRALEETLRRQGEELGRRGELQRGQADELRRSLERIRPNIENLPNIENFTMMFGASRRIGITTTSLTEQLGSYFGVPGRRGLLVTSVSENSPAARAGLRAGDVLTAVDSNQISSAGDLVRALGSRNEGDVRLTVVRDRNSREIRVTPERAEQQEGRMFNVLPFDRQNRMRVVPPAPPRPGNPPRVRQLRRVI